MLIAEGRDITYIKKIEQEHRNMVVQLQETAAMRRTFVSTLTHDLKTPLIAQGRVLDSLQNEKVIIDDRHLTELMKGFIQNNTGVLQMINNLLETYELEDGRIRMIPESLSLYKLVHMCRQELQELLDIRKIVLDIKIPEVFPHIEADALLLKRVFQNLIGNAVSNIPNSSHIWIDVEDWDNYVDISVQDDGPGISEDLRPYLFSRYLSGASRQKKIGSGLGLYICKMISELHGGTIRVDSESGKGTKISFTILKETTSHDA
jgi:signal transduction histidine kinase